MNFPKPKKHVIFLGAGASVTSGYPDANRLSVLMCDRWTFFREIANRFQAEGEEHAQQFVYGKSALSTYYKSFQKSVQLLRDGDFATMDELSNLARGGRHSSEIQNLKKLMRFVFALNNPDFTYWARSDYRALIQALFERGSELRSDISVISFNYDPYLEYRLLRAQRARAIVRPVSTELSKRMEQAAASGFLDPTDVEWTRPSGFCHLKLHGTSIFPATKAIGRMECPRQADDLSLTTDHMFRFDTLPRFTFLFDPLFSTQDPPALFPWEIIAPDGKLLEQTEFETIVGPDWQHRSIYPLFRAVWERARSDVQAADKISFVGLSVGPFMEPELKFLFAGKRDIVEAVVANPEAARFKDHPNPFHPSTFPGRMLDIFDRVCPGMCCNRSRTDFTVEQPEQTSHEAALGNRVRDGNRLTIRNDFSDFVRNEM
jgi:hypothetical protein